MKEFLESETVKTISKILLVVVIAICVALVPAIVDFVQGGDFKFEIGGQREVVVYLDPTGGEIAEDSVQVLYEHKYGSLPVPKRDGMDFLGWYTDNGIKVTEETDVLTLSPHTLYAKWGITLYFDTNDGEATKISPQQVVWNSAYGTLPTPKKSGADFLGWYTTPTYETRIASNSIVTSEKNQVLYAKWGVTISFDTNGIGEIESRQIVVGTEYGPLPDLTHENAYFLGWYTEENGGIKVEAESVVNEFAHQVLYARWGVTISFDANGGYTDVESKEGILGNKYGPLPIPIKNDSRFVGWYTTPSFEIEITSNSTISKNTHHTLYAKWDYSYHVHYDANGGMGEMLASAFPRQIETHTLAENTYVRPGYVFAGWSTTSNGIVEYKDCDEISDFAEEHNENARYTKLYAVWKVDPYTIGEYVNNGDVVSDSDGENTYTVYNSIDGTPWSPAAGKNIIDWRNETDTNLLNHTNRIVANSRYNNIDISRYTTEIIFVGDPSKTYTNFRMAICCFEKGREITLSFVNFNFTTNDYAAIVLHEDGGVQLTIESIGTSSIGTTYASGNIIEVNSEYSSVNIVGSGDLILKAGKGANATTAGGNGSNGGTAILANRLTVDITGKLTVNGGDGGNGAKGKDQSLEHKESAAPAKATTDGGKGGNGGDAIKCSIFTANPSSNIIIAGGNGGNGGNGGAAGDGYGGFQKEIGSLIAGSYSKDATLPDGANGGNGGNGGAPINTSATITISKSSQVYMQYGNGGNGGDGGQGADAAWNDNGVYPDTAGNGGNGGAGGVGYIGGKGGNGGKGGYSFANTTGLFANKWQYGQSGSGGIAGNGGNSIKTIFCKNGTETYVDGQVGLGGTGGAAGVRGTKDNEHYPYAGTDRSGTTGTNGNKLEIYYSITWSE